MSPQVRQRIAQETELIDRFSRFYHRKFHDLIDQLNGLSGSVNNAQCLRLCVEAVDMMLITQNQMARALRDLARPSEQVSSTRPRLRPAA